MIDLKHHIYSLVGIFIALATGILIGIGLAGGTATQSMAIERQSDRIQSLQREFKAFSAEIAGKDAEIKGLADHLKDVDVLVGAQLKQIVSGQLAGRGVALVHFGTSVNVESVKRALIAAGAVVHSDTTLRSDFLSVKPDFIAKTAKSLPFAFQQSDKDPLDLIYSYLSAVLLQGLQGDPLAGLKQVGAVDLDGDYSVPNKFLVIIVPSDIDQKLVDSIVSPLTRHLMSKGMKVAVATSSPSKQSSGAKLNADIWKDVDAAVVEHTELAVGRICVVYALLAGEGRYGLRSDEKILPDNLPSGNPSR